MSGLWLCCFSVVVGLGSFDAWSAPKPKKNTLTELQSVRIDSSGHLILKFSKPVKALRMKTEALPGKVQFSFEDVFIRQAELFRFERAPIAKVFAYQFTPKIVRLRLFSDMPTETLMSKLAVRQEGFLWSIPLGAYLEPVMPSLNELDAMKEPHVQEVEKLERALEKEMTEKAMVREESPSMIGSIRFWTSLLSVSLLSFGLMILMLSRRRKTNALAVLGTKEPEHVWFEILNKMAFCKGTEIWFVKVQSKVVALLVKGKSLQVMTEYEADVEAFESTGLQVSSDSLEPKTPWQPSPQLRHRIHSRLEGLKPL